MANFMHLPMAERLEAIAAMQAEEMAEGSRKDAEALAMIDKLEAEIEDDDQNQDRFEREFFRHYDRSPVGHVEAMVAVSFGGSR